MADESSNPKYQQIARELRQEIASRYVAGDYLPSARTLGKRFQTTVRTIRSALRQLEAAGLVRTLPSRGSIVLPQMTTEPLPKAPNGGELPASLAGNGKARRGNVVALVVPLETFMISVLVPGAERELRRHGYRLQLCGTYTLAQIQADAVAAQAYERAILESLGEDVVAGVIWWSTFGHRNRDVAQWLQERGLPVVLVDNPVPKLACDWVGIDDYGAAFGATRYLLALGHKHIAFWAFEIADFIPPVDGERLAGFMDALRQANGPKPDEQGEFPISLAGLPRRELERILAPEIFRRIFLYDTDTLDDLLTQAPRPTAVLVANDHIAGPLICELEQRGVRVPQDMAVVSFADIDRYTGRTSRLTTVRQPFELMAQRAVRLLLMRLRDPSAPLQHLFLPTQLIVRQSCGGTMPPPADSETGAAVQAFGVPILPVRS